MKRHQKTFWPPCRFSDLQQGTNICTNFSTSTRETSQQTQEKRQSLFGAYHHPPCASCCTKCDYENTVKSFYWYTIYTRPSAYDVFNRECPDEKQRNRSNVLTAVTVCAPLIPSEPGAAASGAQTRNVSKHTAYRWAAILKFCLTNYRSSPYVYVDKTSWIIRETHTHTCVYHKEFHHNARIQFDLWRNH